MNLIRGDSSLRCLVRSRKVVALLLSAQPGSNKATRSSHLTRSSPASWSKIQAWRVFILYSRTEWVITCFRLKHLSRNGAVCHCVGTTTVIRALQPIFIVPWPALQKITIGKQYRVTCSYKSRSARAGPNSLARCENPGRTICYCCSCYYLFDVKTMLSSYLASSWVLGTLSTAFAEWVSCHAGLTCRSPANPRYSHY